MKASPTHRAASRLIGYWALALLPACGGALAAPVGVVEDFELTDAARSRQVPLKIYYPLAERAGGYPVVIFSHGAGGSKDSYEYLGRFWAENGYVVIHPDHAGSDRAILRSGRVIEALKAAVVDPSNMVNRPLDVSCIIDSLASIARAVPELRDRMDGTRIGVAGHSFGAYTAMALAGAVIHLPGGGKRTFGDRRIAAFIAMSPQGPGDIGFSEDSWGAITRPMLTMSGTEDRELSGGSPAERLKAFQHMPPGGKFHVTIAGVTHMDFGDHRFDGYAPPEKFHEIIKRVGLAFWDAALSGGDASAAAFGRRLGEEGVADAGGALSAFGATGSLQSK